MVSVWLQMPQVPQSRSVRSFDLAGNTSNGRLLEACVPYRFQFKTLPLPFARSCVVWASFQIDILDFAATVRFRWSSSPSLKTEVGSSAVQPGQWWELAYFFRYCG